MTIRHRFLFPRARGFSLVELMVALLIGLIVVGGLVSVLMANRQAFNVQQGNNFNQENLRFGMGRVAWSLRMADFWGGVKTDDIVGLSDASGVKGTSGDCTGAWVLSVGKGKENGIRGYDGAATFPIAGCVDTGNYVKYSDVVVVRYADTRGYDPTKATGANFDSTDPTVVPNRTTYFLVASVAQQGNLFYTGTPVPPTPISSVTGRYVYPYQFEMYYLRPCSDPGADQVCGTADDGDAASRIPTLMRMRMSATGALMSEVVSEGIEQLQFEYASPGAPFQPAAASNFAAVTQVRVSMVARAAARDTGVPHPASLTVSGHCQYAIDAAGKVTYGTGLPSDNACKNIASADFGSNPQQFTRVLSQQVVVLRNRVRG